MPLKARRCLIPELLKERGWTQRLLAEKSGVNEKVISKYTTFDRKQMSLAIAVQLADALDVSPRDLYEWSQE
ncbi:Cro/C1-type helix-turn-helix DNA-binding protein [Paenibacillus sp. BK033]|uniref:helix-turn-helix domain-containing protein n=1 Tax=Paenibacillus sp. BK033 TaxID=2512133 RepID=UPI001052D4D0|nr:helix-turn-helix transcriptional regulator [Paenibacillus sp. BK033]TCM89653.1 Cro/C1-type helix-turn-helix DNA-binding protein [Paenibacillus sp. BK033]